MSKTMSGMLKARWALIPGGMFGGIRGIGRRGGLCPPGFFGGLRATMRQRGMVAGAIIHVSYRSSERG